MKNLIEYRWAVENLFFEYLKDRIQVEELLDILYKLERNLQDEEKDETKELWFRLFRDDTIVTTLSDMERALSSSTNTKDKEYIKKGMEVGISLENEIEIYFS